MKVELDLFNYPKRNLAILKSEVYKIHKDKRKPVTADLSKLCSEQILLLKNT